MKEAMDENWRWEEDYARRGQQRLEDFQNGYSRSRYSDDDDDYYGVKRNYSCQRSSNKRRSSW